ncbi:MAG: T9SS type A sorting domain-containing protein [Bacteroidetes bacterium]|nr:T9SS type A sorting domain-containing protein [Bacteroidota bacterium]
MKRKLLSLLLLGVTTFQSKASNYAFDLTASGTNYLTTTTAPLSGNSAFTIEFWYNNNGNAYGSYARLIGFDNYASDIALNNGILQVYDGSWRATTANTGLNTGWHHVAVTNNQTNMFVYVDGVQVYTKASATYNFTGNKMYVGISYSLFSNDRVSAYYDEIRVWNTARTLQEINDNRIKQLEGTETNLVAYYPMHKGSVADLSASANNLIITGAVYKDDFPFGEYINDYSLNFDGTDDKCEVAGAITGNSNFTLEAQFKTSATSFSAYRRIFGWDSFGLEVAIGPGATLATYKNSWANTIATNLNDGNWHHVAVTHNSGTLTIFVDGVQVGQRTVTLNLSGTMVLGGRYSSGGGGEFFDGNIDEVRIWNTPRNINDIIACMDSTLEGTETGLMAYYDMNTPASTILNSVTTGSNLTRIGATGTNNLPQFVVDNNKVFAPSVLYTSGAIICNSGVGTLSATPSSGTVNWYAASTGGVSIGTGNTFTTPTLTVSTTYYVDATANSATTGFRIPVIASVNQGPNDSISQNGNILSSIEVAAAFHWYNCTTMQTISGDTTSTYTATVNGNYAVIVEKNGCVDTSACVNVLYNTVSNAQFTDFTITPNPAKEYIKVSNYNSTLFDIEIRDISGKIIFKEQNIHQQLILNTANYNEGVYIIKISTNNQTHYNRIVIQ